MTCFFNEAGLPVYLVDERDEAPIEEISPVKMALRSDAFESSNLDIYLREELGLKSPEDFVRHDNGKRGGVRYFTIVSDAAVTAILARADQLEGQLAKGTTIRPINHGR